MNATLTRSVPFFKYPHVFLAHEGMFLEIFRKVGRRGAFILQEELLEFERNLASYLKVKHALGVGNATDGLILCLRAAGVGAGDEVILSSHTMVATAAAVHFVGGVPIPVDAGVDHLIDPDAVESAITSRTKAILPTQLNGRVCDMDRLQDIAQRHGLIIVEDAAQALGAKYRGRSAGTFGAAAAFSFYPAKVLGCFGDGGAVVTNDDSVYEQLCQLRDHGRDSRGQIVSWGLNSRLDNLQAAFLIYQLSDYDQVVRRRRELALAYTERLGRLERVVLPPPPGVDPDHFDVFQNFEIQAGRRDALKSYLAERGVGTLVQWNGQAIHHLTSLGFTQSLPKTDRLFERLLMLPLNMSLMHEDVEYVCDLIVEFYRG
jgi:dTDP-4-amino-4,6-dideoxygalactose transaminase